RSFRRPDAPHRMMNSAGTEPTLRNLKPSSRPQQYIFRGYSHLIKAQCRMAAGSKIKSHYGQLSLDHDTSGFQRNEDHGMLTVGIGARVGSAHYDRNFAKWIPGPGYKPLFTVNNPFVTS